MQKYHKQVQLLVSVLPYVATEECFALKGGTAINLFIRDMPRLSVDIDLQYMYLSDRITAIARIKKSLVRIAEALEKSGSHSILQKSTKNIYKIICSNNNALIKIEPN